MRKMMSIVLCSMLALAVLSACSSNGKAGEEQAPGSSPAGQAQQDQNQGGAVKEEKVKISILNGMWDNYPANVDINNNKWTGVIKKAFPNLEIEWILPPRAPQQLEQKKQLLMGSGQFPTLVPATKTDMINWADSGLIIPVDEYIEQYMPELKRYLSDDEMKNGQYLGKQYLIPTPKSALENPQLLYIRKDWLDKLSLQMPQTTDELMEVLRAFTTKDPDGNNKNDTYGIISQKNLVLLDNTLALAFGVNLATANNNLFWHQADGGLVPDIIRPEAKEALAYFRELYEAGIYDKESLVLDFAKMEEKVTTGKYGVTSFFSNGIWGRMNNNVKKSDPQANFVLLPPLKGPDGVQGQIPRSDNIGQLWAITAGTTPAQAEAAAKLLNWFMEPDTSVDYVKNKGDDLNTGELGVHSELLGGKYLTEMADNQMTPEAIEDKYRFSYRIAMSSAQMLPDDEWLAYSKLRDESRPGFYQDVKASVELGVRNALRVPGPVMAQHLPDLVTYFDEVKMKIITGNEPLEAFDKWVDYFYKNHGQEIIDEANKLNQ